MIVYLNGQFIDQQEAKVSVNDRGFIFGDGVYEVIRIINGRQFQARPHLERLKEGLELLQIEFEDSRIEELPEIGAHLLQKNDLLEGEATIYLQITRGTADRTHEFPDPPVEPTVFLSAKRITPAHELHQAGASAITIPDVRWTRCNIKSVNLLPNVLAKQRAKEAGAFSSIMIRDGVVTEGQNANVFCVNDGVLYTYPRSNYILAGITRDVVFKMAAELDIEVREHPVSEDQLYDMDEVFLSGTTTDIQGITEIDGITIGEGIPGPVTLKLVDQLRSEMEALTEKEPG